MKRETFTHGLETELLRVAADLYDLNINDITAIKSSKGYVNLIYDCQHRERPSILRISFRLDRTRDLIHAELHFIDYLAAQGMGVSIPFVSKNHKYVETVLVEDHPIHMVCFEKVLGVHDQKNGGRSLETTIDQHYYRKWGVAMGQLHALSKFYKPLSDAEARPDWFELHSESLDVDKLIPSEMSLLSEKIHRLLALIGGLPKDKESYGMIHGDFVDKKFTINPLDDTLTVFDFDDSCYFWFAFEIALAWEEVISRADQQKPENRELFFNENMQAFLDGYSEENELPDEWARRIPLFGKLAQSKDLLDCLKSKFDAELGISDPMKYLTQCIEEDLPHLNFFEELY